MSVNIYAKGYLSISDKCGETILPLFVDASDAFVLVLFCFFVFFLIWEKVRTCCATLTLLNTAPLSLHIIHIPRQINITNQFTELMLGF